MNRISVLALIFLLGLCLIPPVVSHTHSHSHGQSHSHGHSHSHKTSEKKVVSQPPIIVEKSKQYTAPEETEKKSEIWEPILATAIIGIAPILILPQIPLERSENVLKVMLSFAAGGLLGDVFLHLLPHSMEALPEETEGQHDHSAHIGVGLWVMTGFLIFFVIEKVIMSFQTGEDQGHSHSHSHSHGEKEKPKKDDKPNSQKTQQEIAPIAISGYLNIIADTMHNFTDGLAIGASFLAGRGVGIVTTVAIFFHEIPHEIGDYAILIKSGFPKEKAIAMQFFTAIGALMGTFSGLFAGEYFGDPAAWILPMTAGGFVYVGTVSILGELSRSKSSGFQTLYEILAMLVGVGLMVAVAYFE